MLITIQFEFPVELPLAVGKPDDGHTDDKIFSTPGNTEREFLLVARLPVGKLPQKVGKLKDTPTTSIQSNL